MTTFISFILELEHRSQLIELRTELGTAEPFFIHLFKGCVLFESLLKANPKEAPRPENDTLGKILKQLQPRLGFGAEDPIEKKIGGYDFQTIINDLPSDDSSAYTAVVRTGRIRNTTGHNLGWQVSLPTAGIEALAAYVASSCLHAIACLYR